MTRRPPRSTRTDTLFPYTTLFRSKPQCVQLAQMVFRVLARLRQLPFQPAVPFQPLAVVAVELQQLVVLHSQCLVGLAQGDSSSVGSAGKRGTPPRARSSRTWIDGKSAVEGTRGSVSVKHGGGRNYKK